MSTLNAKVVGFVKTITKEEKNFDHVIIELPSAEEYDFMPPTEKIQVAHDYVRLTGRIYIEQVRDENCNYPVQKTLGASNWIHTTGSITIGIRDMFEVILPLLNKHPYLTKEHVCIREEGTEKAYPAYAYEGCVIQYTSLEDKTSMVAFRRAGETKYEHVSLKLFDQIKDTLKLSLTQKDLDSGKY